MDVGTTLQTARGAAKLSQGLLGRLAGLSESEVRDAEEGRIELSAAKLDRCARVFGVRLDDLLNGVAGSSPLSLLMRSTLEGRPSSEAEAIATELHQGLGEFLRVIRDVADLETALGRAQKPVPDLPDDPVEREHRAETRARTVREHLGLGTDPVRSIRRVAEEGFGIHVVWVTEDHLTREVDGACTRDPRPALLVNLLEPERSPWRTRITLAHELGHLLFDVKGAGHRALVSPYGKTGQAALRIEQIERLARAFAACFLAPAEGVRREIGARDASSEAAIRIVGSTFGVGRTVAITRLKHVFKLSDDARMAMQARPAEPYEGDFSGDAVNEPLGFRGGALHRLVREAVVARKITGRDARRLLGLTPADALPFADLDDATRAPLVSADERMRRRADAHLAADAFGAGLVAERAERTGDIWRITVVSGGVGMREPAPRGYLVLSRNGEVLEDRVEPVPRRA